jgi:15-cis-phytoene synthase
MRRASRLEGAYAHCETLLRANDKDRFLANLFLPAEARPHVNALHAFSFEVAHVREVVREPIAGEVRHQWWREAILGEGRGEVGASPVAAALLDTIARTDLPLAPLVTLIAARGFDLYDAPMTNLVALDGYCRETSGVLFQLAVRVLGSTPLLPWQASLHAQALEAAVFHSGCAYAFTGLIRALPLHASRGQVYLPGDLLARHGADREDVICGKTSPPLLAAINDWRNEARRHLAAAGAAIAALPDLVKPAFLPLALVEPYLRLTEQRGYDPFHSAVELPQWRRQWALWRAS